MDKLALTRRNNFLWFVRELLKEIFKVSLITYLLFYLIDEIKTGFISNYFDLNILLAATIASGVLVFLIHGEGKTPAAQPVGIYNYVIVYFLSLSTGIIIYYLMRSFGAFSYLISAIAVVLIASISIFLVKDPLNK